MDDVMADDTESSSAQARKKGNLRLALVLVSIVLVFFLGFIAKMALLGN